jgi:hypothetical protein
VQILHRDRSPLRRFGTTPPHHQGRRRRRRRRKRRRSDKMENGVGDKRIVEIRDAIAMIQL